MLQSVSRQGGITQGSGELMFQVTDRESNGWYYTVCELGLWCGIWANRLLVETVYQPGYPGQRLVGQVEEFVCR
jgi:hypothetical protein